MSNKREIKFYKIIRPYIYGYVIGKIIIDIVKIANNLI